MLLGYYLSNYMKWLKVISIIVGYIILWKILESDKFIKEKWFKENWFWKILRFTLKSFFLFMSLTIIYYCIMADGVFRERLLTWILGIPVASIIFMSAFHDNVDSWLDKFHKS